MTLSDFEALKFIKKVPINDMVIHTNMLPYGDLYEGKSGEHYILWREGSRYKVSLRGDPPVFGEWLKLEAGHTGQ